MAWNLPWKRRSREMGLKMLLVFQVVFWYSCLASNINAYCILFWDSEVSFISLSSSLLQKRSKKNNISPSIYNLLLTESSPGTPVGCQCLLNILTVHAKLGSGSPLPLHCSSSLMTRRGFLPLPSWAVFSLFFFFNSFTTLFSYPIILQQIKTCH